MKKIIATLSILFCAPWAWGSGTSNLLQVSSGTFLPISLYSNPDAGNRQAIIIGDRVSSATVNVDPVTGLSVTISSGSSPIGNVNIISTNTLPVSGTFFQANQPVNFNNVVQPILITSGTVNVITTNTIPVSGTFFQATQPIQGTVNVISTQPFTVISTGVVTQPVSGTFFQANQPVSFNNIAQPVLITSGTLNVISTQPFTVYGTTVQVVNTTSTIQNIQNALPGGSNSLGNVNITSTNTLAVSGSFSATALSTGAINTAAPGVANYAGYIGPAGTIMPGRVTLSSETVVYVNNPTTTTVSISAVNIISSNSLTVGLTTTSLNNTTVTIQNIQNALPGGSNSLGNVNIISTNTLAVSGSFSATTVFPDTGPINGLMPGIAGVSGFTNPQGNVQAGRVTSSSETEVYVNNLSTVTFNGVTQPIALTSTPTVTVILSTVAVSNVIAPATFGASVGTTGIPIGGIGSNSNFQAFRVNTTSDVYVYTDNLTTVTFNGATQPVAITSTPTMIVIQSTLGVVGIYSDNGVSSTTNRITMLGGVYQNGSNFHGGVVGTAGKDGAYTLMTDGGLVVHQTPDMSVHAYAASTNTFTVATSTNDAAALCGNAKDTIVVTGIRASCTQTTAGIVQIGIVKRSSAYSGVWSTMTVVPQSSNATVTNSTATFFTSANLVVGTLLGYLDSYKLGCMATGTATPNDIYISPSDWKYQPIILNSASECVAVNMNGATISGGAMSVSFYYREGLPNNFNP